MATFYEVTDEISEIDLSKLISFSMSFQPLQLLFQGVLKRVKQVETDNVQQDEEIDQLKKALEEMRQRDIERERQLEELLRQQKEQQLRHYEQKEKESSIQAGEAGDQHVDLSTLWNEVEKIKEQLGDFWCPGYRHSIEQLYEARKRQDSRHGAPLEGKQQRKASVISGEEASEAGTTKGDVILDRAKEELIVSEDICFLPSRRSCLTPSGELMDPHHMEREKRKSEDVQRAEGVRQSTTVPSSVTVAKREATSSEGRKTSSVRMAFLQKEKPEQISGGIEGSDSSHSVALSASRNKSPTFDLPFTVNDRLRQDANDIEYLNRVVAEMLNEMRDLHADVDLMRTVTAGADESNTEQTISAQENKNYNDLRRRVKTLEDDLGYLRDKVNRSTKATASVAERVDVPKPVFVPAETRRMSMVDDLQKLKDRMDAVDRAQERVNNKLETAISALSASEGDAGVNPVHLSVLEASVKTLEKQLADMQNLGLRNYDDELGALQHAVSKLQGETKALERACSLLDENKEDKSKCRTLSESSANDEKEKKTQVVSPLRSSPSMLSGVALAEVNDLLHRLEELQERLARAEECIKELDGEKANTLALQRINDDMRHLRHMLELGAGNRGDDVAASTVAAMHDDLLQKVQQQFADHLQNINKMRDGTTSELEALRNYVEKIDHCKADAKLVANKAERDYVENALERLMREVEQVLNATNAGLIDTLDKSLNVLRDMLDGKATKNDMDNLQRLVTEEHGTGGAPDALLGFRGFRCLGCNRAVETMRPRIMGNRLQPFVNRLPQNHPADPVAAGLYQVSSNDRNAKPAMLKNN